LLAYGTNARESEFARPPDCPLDLVFTVASGSMVRPANWRHTAAALMIQA
jgi:hypothetical protein